MSVIIESQFEHDGYECFTTFNNYGFRCGYVVIPKDHILFGKQIDQSIGVTSKEYEEYLGAKCYFSEENSELTLGQYFSVHGGVTLTDVDYHRNTDNWIIGFDCGHGTDNIDAEKLLEYFGVSKSPLPFGTLRSLSYVEDNCRGLVSQIHTYLQLLEWKTRKPV